MNSNVPEKAGQSSLVRRATKDDLPTIARIHRLAFFAAMPHMPALHTPAEDLAFYRKHVFPMREIWLTEESEITGFIAFGSGWTFLDPQATLP